MKQKYISYRVTFSLGDSLVMENAANINLCPNLYYTIIQEILDHARFWNIEWIWFFYEPYVEITWLSTNKSDSEHFINMIRDVLDDANIKDFKITNSEESGFGPDWFCKSEEEMYFGAKRYSICRQFVELYNDYKRAVDNGKTLKEQIKRTIHGLCNPLGLNYKDEAYICFSRGLICLLFCLFNFKTAVWIYTKIFRQKF